MSVDFPIYRPRRTRATENLRAMIRETEVSVKDLISLSNLNENLAGQNSLGCKVFSFHYFEYIVSFLSGL